MRMTIRILTVATLQWLVACMASGAGPAAGAAAAMDNGTPRAAIRVDARTIEQLLEATRALERDNGPFDAQLGEQLSSLGLAYQQNGDYAHAADTLGRALHIKRVNDGLQSLSQLPVLEELIASNVAAKNWEDLDQDYQMLLWVHRRNFSHDDPRFLPIVDRIGRWKLQAYRDKLLKQSPTATLHEAEQLYSHTVELLENQYGKTDSRLVDPLYGAALAHYQIMKETASRPLESFGGAAGGRMGMVRYQQFCARTRAGVVCRTVPIASSGIDGYVEDQDRKNRAIYGELQQVKTALQKIVGVYEANPDLARNSYAYALVHLGDWYTLADQLGNANEQYKKAFDVLARADTNQEEIAKIFGRPVSVPALQLPLADVEDKLAQEREYVDVSFDVTKTGHARNIQIIDEAKGNAGAQRKVKKMLSESRFRPRLENGEAVDTFGLKAHIPAPT